MILSKKYYIRSSLFKRLWNKRQIRNLSKNSMGVRDNNRIRITPRFVGNSEDIKKLDAKKIEQACPTNALEVSMDEIKISEKNCIGCMECVKVSATELWETNLEKLPNDLDAN